MADTFSKEYIIAAINTDLFNMCKPSSLMGFLQDAADGHSEVLGMHREALVQRANSAWVLARMYYKLYKPIPGEEKITVTTWHRKPRASTIYRDFDIHLNGEHIGEAVTLWVVMELFSHKITRLIDIDVIRDSVPYKHCKTAELSKLKAPEPLYDVEKRLMRYSDTDINGHVNNVRYADFACDALSVHRLKNQYISGMHINFSTECFAGEDILMRTGESELVHTGGKSSYVAGFGPDDKLRFEAQLETSPL